MTQKDQGFQPPAIDPNVVIFDEQARVGVRAARQSVEKVWLSMCLGSVISMTFALAMNELL